MVWRIAVGDGRTHLSQNLRRQLRALEELYSNLAGHDTHLLGVGLAKELAEHALLFGREVERGVCVGGANGQRKAPGNDWDGSG